MVGLSLQVLAKKGGNLGMVDNRGDSAVYWAARQGHQDVVQYLISQGVHVNQQNKVPLKQDHISEQNTVVIRNTTLSFFDFIMVCILQEHTDHYGDSY